MQILTSKLNNLLDFLFPKTCLFCGAFGEYVCANCREEKIEILSQQYCHVCKKPIKDFGVHEECKEKTSLDGVKVICKYNKFIERIISEVKYNYYFKTADFLGELLLQAKNSIENNSIDVIVPIPIHRKRLWKRGFNQSELLANFVGKQLNIPVILLIKRVRNTKTQVGLNRAERLKNLSNAFEINLKKVYIYNKSNEAVISLGEFQNGNALLIDDVMTTGTTLEECSKVLKYNGMKKVFGLVVARG